MPNRYFHDYYREHGQGGTNAQQRNLLPLFKVLLEEDGHRIERRLRDARHTGARDGGASGGQDTERDPGWGGLTGRLAAWRRHSVTCAGPTAGRGVRLLR